MKFKILISIFFLIGFNSFGQKRKIDKFCSKLESSLISEKIILHSVQHQTDFADAYHYDHYYIDTSKRILVKSIYEFEFEGGEILEFYYRNIEIIKVKAKHKSHERKFTGIFYFKSGKLIGQTDGEISPGEMVFDLQQILKTGNGYLKNSVEIIKLFKKTNP